MAILKQNHFFENLLLEGEIKDLVVAHSKNSIRSELGFLREFGADCAGAFKIFSVATSKMRKVNGAKKELKLEMIYQSLTEKKSLTEVMLNQE